MEIIQQQFKQRSPRFGIEQERLEGSGILLNDSPCILSDADGDSFTLEIQSIVNISVGGIKLTVINPEKLVLDAMDLKVVFNAPSKGDVYKLKGRITWSEHLTGGNSWIGVELNPRPDVLRLFTELTGQQP